MYLKYTTFWKPDLFPSLNMLGKGGRILLLAHDDGRAFSFRNAVYFNYEYT
jgi:hypothetical protein